MGRHLMGRHLMDRHLMGRYPMGRHFMDGHLMDGHLMSRYLIVSGKERLYPTAAFGGPGLVSPQQGHLNDLTVANFDRLLVKL